MSEEKEEVVEMDEVVETKDEVAVVAEPKDNNDDIFITEKNRFTVEIKYYVENNEPMVDGFDDEYEDEGKETKDFTLEFKYPSQRDAEIIMATKAIENIAEAGYVDFVEIESVRMMTLIRGWSLDRPLSDLAEIHPKIIKAVRFKISNEIAGNGLW